MWSLAGYPETVSPGATSPITPAWAAMRASAPIFRWPISPACPPIDTPGPVRVEPAMPTWAAKIDRGPIFTLWAMCTKLSSLDPAPITVRPIEPRSIVQLAPISTSSSTTHSPAWGTFTCMPLAWT